RTSRSSASQSGCRASRIEKPRSNHNSPGTAERRKTTIGTKLYATLDDHYNMMMGLTGEEEATEGQQQPAPARPMSWHPASTHFNAPSHSSAAFEHTQPQDWSRHYAASSRNSAYGSDFYSLSARNSMHAEPVQNYPAYPNGHEAHRGSQESDGSWQTPSYALSSYSTPATEPMPWYLQEWARKNQAQAMDSQHGSTDFLPIQNPAMEQELEAADEEMEDSGKELVGMGLYDLPDPALTWSSGLVEATGKGLKLEETWQPPEEEDDDDDDNDGEADDASSEGSVEEPPPPPPARQQPQVPVTVKPQTPGSMEGQSFFFDEDETISKEWWFQQLKQPSMPVRDAGIGYGWL
ncbi:hypothetical protein BU26DRAFT_398723, partial [Trematosphaeria pertusa]